MEVFVVRATERHHPDREWVVTVLAASGAQALDFILDDERGIVDFTPEDCTLVVEDHRAMTQPGVVASALAWRDEF